MVQAVPIYISEMAPPKFRGALNIIFQLMTTLGIVVASLINYGDPIIAQLCHYSIKCKVAIIMYLVRMAGL